VLVVEFTPHGDRIWRLLIQIVAEHFGDILINAGKASAAGTLLGGFV